MEKERLFSSSGHMMPVSDMATEQANQLLQPCFLNLNWEQSIEQNSHFESALSSIVSSPSNNPPATGGESVVIGELIGRLGSICNSGEISPQSHHYIIGGNNNNNSTNTSCYSTPLNSPPKLNLSMMERHHHAQANLPTSGNLVLPPATHLGPFAADPGFTERAARFSCFGSRNYGGLPHRVGVSQMSISEILIQDGSQMEMEMRPKFDNMLSRAAPPNNEQLRSVHEEPSASGHMVVSGSNSRKRKTAQRGRAKEDLPKVSQEENLNAKRSKSLETAGAGKGEVRLKVEKSSTTNSCESGGKPEKENNSKPSEPSKQDYIHVRARRGQATDSHSLAERVRREKISERMKFLQDLVPGCNKVTGKAVMLDEIINYVQSLQRQVEFLSMKLATVNPQMDFNMENLFHKDMHQSCGSLPLVFPPDTLAPLSAFVPQPPNSAPLQSIMSNSLEAQCPVNSLDSRRPLGVQVSTLDGFSDSASQVGTFWNDELQHVFQMGFGQNQEFSSTAFQGALPTTTHMKIEL